MNIDVDELNRRIKKGLITVRKHPFLELYIYNYTHKTQYNRLWDQYTEKCRGLILDNNYNILNNPFPKFYNLGENEKVTIRNLPLETPIITDKVDGMLGILYREEDKIAITARGSFTSDQDIWATNWLRKKGYKSEDFNIERSPPSSGGGSIWPL